MVRPQYRGAHSYLTRFSPICAISKTINLSKFLWYERLAREECQHYIGYLGVGEKKFGKYCMVRPQYRGAHSYLTRFSPICAISKIINLSKFLWYECLAREECQHYIGYLGAAEKKFGKFCMVRPQYHGAHSYLTRFSPICTSSKKLWLMIYMYPRNRVSTARSREDGLALLEAASTRYGTFREIRYHHTSSSDRRGELLRRSSNFAVRPPPPTAPEVIETFFKRRG
jgi:hypothetical protein